MDYIIFPAVAAFVGWITNVMAIRLLFRPYDPIRIPILKLEIQGVLPRRKKALARAIAEVIEGDLLSREDLWAKLEDRDVEDALVKHILSLFKDKFKSLYPSWLPERFGSYLYYLLEDWIEGRIREIIPEMRSNLKGEILSKLALRDLVESKVNSFDFRELERLVKKIASRELRFIEVAGGVLGLIIGLIQVILLRVLG